MQNNNCITPNDVLGKHYTTAAENLFDKFPKITNDYLPSTSKLTTLKQKLNNIIHFQTNNYQIFFMLSQLLEMRAR